MAITYPIDLPPAPGFVSLKWSPRSAVAEQESPFTYHNKVYVWDGQQRLIVVKLPPMSLARAKEWQAWALKLNGTEGTFYLRDSVGAALRGAATGAGLVKGAGQLGATLNTDGWANSVAGLFMAGDWVQLGTRLYTVLETVNSDGAGNASLTLWPKIRTSPADNYVILYGTAAKGVFRLTGFPEFAWEVSRLMEGFEFTAKEEVQ